MAEARDWLMYHRFSGDPWGLCSQCQHPAWHDIHRDREQEARDKVVLDRIRRRIEAEPRSGEERE